MKSFNKINAQVKVSQRFLKAISWEGIYFQILYL